jgi:hypothetical protein
MQESWRDSVEENRDTLETWADSDLPLSEEVAELLDRADAGTSADEMEVAAG